MKKEIIEIIERTKNNKIDYDTDVEFLLVNLKEILKNNENYKQLVFLNTYNPILLKILTKTSKEEIIKSCIETNKKWFYEIESINSENQKKYEEVKKNADNFFISSVEDCLFYAKKIDILMRNAKKDEFEAQKKEIGFNIHHIELYLKNNIDKLNDKSIMELLNINDLYFRQVEENKLLDYFEKNNLLCRVKPSKATENYFVKMLNKNLKGKDFNEFVLHYSKNYFGIISKKINELDNEIVKKLLLNFTENQELESKIKNLDVILQDSNFVLEYLDKRKNKNENSNIESNLNNIEAFDKIYENKEIHNKLIKRNFYYIDYLLKKYPEETNKLLDNGSYNFRKITNCNFAQFMYFGLLSNINNNYIEDVNKILIEKLFIRKLYKPDLFFSEEYNTINLLLCETLIINNSSGFILDVYKNKNLNKEDKKTLLKYIFKKMNSKDVFFNLLKETDIDILLEMKSNLNNKDFPINENIVNTILNIIEKKEISESIELKKFETKVNKL